MSMKSFKPRCVRPSAWVVVLLTVLPLGGCDEQSSAGAEGSGAAARTLTDDLGRTVELDGTPQRIATTDSFVVQYLLALEHPPVLRPDTEPAELSEAALDIPALAVDHSVGPNMEQLAAAEPDLVILSPTFARFAEAIDQQLGIPTLVYRIDALEDVPAKAEAFGRLIGKTEAGQALAQRLSDEIDAVSPPEGAERPKVFAMFGTPAAFYAFRPSSYLGTMVEALGGQLIVPSDGAESPSQSNQIIPFSMELLVSEQPDVILMVHHGPPGSLSGQLEQRPVWSELEAVRNDRVHRISEQAFFASPGPGAAEAMRELRALLYPESP